MATAIMKQKEAPEKEIISKIYLRLTEGDNRLELS